MNLDRETQTYIHVNIYIHALDWNHTRVWRSSSHTSVSSSVRRHLLIGRCVFYNIQQQLLETAAKDVWKKQTKTMTDMKLYHWCSYDDIHLNHLIISLGEGDSWEQITGDSVEQRNVMGEKFGLIHIFYGPQDLGVLTTAKKTTTKVHSKRLTFKTRAE